MLRAVRPVLLALLLLAPALALRLTGVELAAPVAVLVFGLGVVAASFVLAWAAEAAEVDIAGGLAVAILAVIVVLPEYAVDLYFAYQAGERPEYVQYAAANMTGSNRLLLGLGLVGGGAGLAPRRQSGQRQAGAGAAAAGALSARAGLPAGRRGAGVRDAADR